MTRITTILLHVLLSRLPFLVLCIGLIARGVYMYITPAEKGWDWDEVLMIAMGFAGLAYIIADLKRERKLDELAVEHAERIARLEAIAVDDMTVETRIAALEVRAERDQHLEERLASVGERVAVLEVKWDQLPDT